MATRIERLAQPKADLLKFPDRRSVYWLDELPAESNGSTTTFELTARWSQLTDSKRLNSSFQDSRRSPIWNVSAAALKACPSTRVCSLALPRLPTAGWQPDRPLLAALSDVLRTAVPSRRVCQLARPKRMMMQYQNEAKTSVSATPPATASSRIHLLATPKSDHPQYYLDRPVSWPLPGPVREAVASERVEALSIPKPRRALFEGYNPYCVSQAARMASASPRVLELSEPLPRKCKRK